MPQNQWTDKQERKYEKIEKSEEKSGHGEKEAKRIAAATVNKERARSGESQTASKSSIDDISSSRRGGLRSGHGSSGRTYDQLYGEAQRENIKGRSKMTKKELQDAVKH